MQNPFGFLNINKPVNCTSHDVVAMLRKAIGIKKIGHSGTLDPFASGVLVIGIGDATRLFEYLPLDKVYIAEITFGIGTDTDDVTGKIIKKSDKIPIMDEIESALREFVGKIKQKPPTFSAININGTRAYKLARENKIVQDDLKEREIEIYSIEIVSYFPPLLTMQIHCSGGTYIRSIARDLGCALNSCAMLSKLQRIKGNIFSLEKSLSPELINETNVCDYLILPQNVIELEKICVDSEQVIDIVHGKEIKIPASCTNINKNLQIIDNNGRLIGIGFLTETSVLKPKKVFLKKELISNAQG